MGFRLDYINTLNSSLSYYTLNQSIFPNIPADPVPCSPWDLKVCGLKQKQKHQHKRGLTLLSLVNHKLVTFAGEMKWEGCCKSPHCTQISFLKKTYFYSFIWLLLQTTALSTHLFPFKKKIFIFISWAMLGLSCGMWDLVPWPGIKPGPPALGVLSLSHWTTREVPTHLFQPVFQDSDCPHLTEEETRVLRL